MVNKKKMTSFNIYEVKNIKEKIKKRNNIYKKEIRMLINSNIAQYSYYRIM